MGFCMVSAEVAEGFPRFLQVSLGAALFGRFAEPQEQKLEKGYHGCAKSYIFVGTISGARKRWNFATVLRGASTVAIIVFCN